MITTGQTIEIKGREYQVDGILETGPNTRRVSNWTHTVGLVGKRGAYYAADYNSETGELGDLIRI